MILSLPLDKEENPKQSLYIPYMVDDEKQNKISILTVGGAEHNRALAHLINKHRFEYKHERIFGFLDNYFDLDHKLNYIADSKYSESFLMALNQPVAGYNAIFVQRTDDENGFSNTWDAKLLGYVLKDKDREYNIVSVYGFSALASVYAIHNVISSIDSNNVLNSNNQYIKNMDRGDIKKDYYDSSEEAYIKKGLTSLYSYKKQDSKKILSEKFKNKHALYIFNNDRNLYKECFMYAKRESIFDGIIKHGRRNEK